MAWRVWQDLGLNGGWGLLGAKGSNTTTETQSYQADPRAAAYAQWLSGQAQTLPGQGAVPLQGVEGFSPDQLAAFQGVRNVQGTYNPYAQRAEALNAEYGRGLDFDRVQDYYNQLSAGPLAQLQNQQRAQMAQTTRNAVQQAGGTGASRIGVTQANLANQQNLATGALQSGLLGQSVGAFQNDLAMKGAAAAQEANLGMGHTAQNYNDLGQLYGIGSAQQGLGQSRLNALYQQGMGQYQNPYQNLQYQSGVLGQLGNIFKGTQTTEKEVPEASPWGTLLGAAGAGLGAYFGGPAGSAALGSLFGGGSKGSGGGYGNSRGDWNPNVPGGRYAVGGAVNPFGGGPRSDLFNQMVKEYFPKNNSMVNPSGIGAGNPFGQMVPGQQTFANGGEVHDFDSRFGNFSAPDLYDPETLSNVNNLKDYGQNSPNRTMPMDSGDVTSPLPRPRPPEADDRPVNPYQNPQIARASLEADDDMLPSREVRGPINLPMMPNTGFQAPERNPWGAVINAAAAALSKHGERTPSGHLQSGTVFGQAARAAGAGLDAGMKTHAAGREEDRKNYEMKLAGERLAEQAAQARLPYEQMTVAERERNRVAEKLANREEWRYIGPSATDPNKSVFLNQRSGETEERNIGVGAKPVGRVLPSPVRKDLESKGSVISQVGDLQEKFRDDYGGPGPEWVGSLKNYAARQFGIGNKESATWWQEYDMYANVARNKLFGSALTAVEYAAWKAATIVPGMDPEMIRENLRIQREQTEKAARKLGLSLTKEGYSRDAIETQLGIDLEGGGGSKGAPPASMLKEGVITTFKDGSSWKLEGGKPVRVGP